MNDQLKEGLERTLGAVEEPSRGLKAVLAAAVLGVAIVVAAIYSRSPNLSHVDVAFLSGSERGNYYAVVSKLAAEVKRQRGQIRNLPSAGSVENMTRLAAAKASCDIQFALVQDGLPWPQGNPFELVGRLSTPESFIVLGRDADRIRTVADLRGMRIGIGPVGSGTEVVARQVLAQLPGLDLKVSTQSVESQLTMLERGELDLAAMVIDADAQLMVEAVRDRKLQIVDIAGADALAHRLAFARAGRITASYYDAVSNLPPVDKRVIQVDALVIGNGCARESVTQGVITAFVRIFPDFVRVNRESPNLTGLPVASAARTYYENDGPDTVGTYVPWFIDIMPTARWVQAIFLISLLFGAQAAWHRFRLWRIDARRVVIEGKVLRLFGPGVTVSEIETMAPEARHTEPAACAMLQKTIDELGDLAERCRRQSVSLLVPMGQEMGYRIQEGLIADLLHALKRFRGRLPQ